MTVFFAGSRKLALLLATFLYAVSVAPLFANNYNDAEVDQNGTCPEFGRGDLRRGGLSFVAHPNVDLFTSADLGAFSVTRTFETAFEPVRVLASQEVSGREARFFVKAMNTDNLCAWISRSDVFANGCFYSENGAFAPREQMRNGPRAMSVTQVDQELPTSCTHSDADGGLLRKVVLHNLNKSRDAAPDQGVLMYRVPGEPLIESNGNQKQLRIFDPFHVFNQAKIEGANGPDRYFLIGRRQQPGASGSASDGLKIHGWVHQKDTFAWDSRHAAFWAGTGNAKGFKELRFLNAEGKAVLDEPTGFILDSTRATAAFPITKELAAGEKNAPERTVQIILPGRACKQPDQKSGGNDSETTQNCVDAIDLEAERQKFLERLNRLSVIDIKFLIDNSRSMDEYFDVIANAVSEIRDYLSSQRNQTLSNPSVRVSVDTYGDYRGGQSSVKSLDFSTIFAFSDVTGGNVRKRLKDALAAEVARTPRDDEKDLREGSFSAVIRAAQDNRWRRDAGFRVIIHLADHGNRTPGQNSGEYKGNALVSDLVERVNYADVAKALCETAIYYAPIAVRGSKFDATANGAFERQGPLIQQAMAQFEGCETRYLNLIKTYSNAVQNDIRDSAVQIERGLQTTVGYPGILAQEVQTVIDCIQNGGTDCSPEIGQRTTGSTVASWLPRIRQGLTQDHGFSQDQLTNIYGQTQTVTALYFPSTSGGQEVFTYWLALSAQDLKALDKTFSTLCGLFGGTGPDTIEVQEMMVEMVARASGDPRIDDASTAREFLGRIMDFPAQHLHNNMVNRSFQEIEAMLESGFDEETNAYAKSVCRTSKLLTAARAQRKIDTNRMEFIDAGDGEFGSWQVPDGATTDFTWSVASLNGVRLFYLPLEYFTSVE